VRDLDRPRPAGREQLVADLLGAGEHRAVARTAHGRREVERVVTDQQERAARRDHRRRARDEPGAPLGGQVDEVRGHQVELFVGRPGGHVGVHPPHA